MERKLSPWASTILVRLSEPAMSITPTRLRPMLIS